MAVYKATYFFIQGKFGWSESFYLNATSSATALVAATANQYINARVALLGQTNVAADRQPLLDTVRVSNAAAPRDTNAFSYGLSPGIGGFGSSADIPNTALLLRQKGFVGANRYQRLMYLRGVPDILTANGGVYVADPIFDASLINWLAALLAVPMGFYLPDLAQTSIDNTAIAQVNPNVTITTVANHGFNVGNLVSVTGVTPGGTLAGRFRVLATPGLTQYTIGPVGLGNVVEGFGKSRRIIYTFVPIDYSKVIRSTHRISGRPFGQPVGRRRVIR